MFEPNFQITPAMSKSLMEIEASRQALVELPIDVDVLAGLRKTAQLLATHYSTQIEGNRLTQAQVEATLAGERFPGRERDEDEVRNYYAALEAVESIAADGPPLDERDLMRIHELVLTGKNKPTPYRDGQNVIRDAGSGTVVYMPPEAKDVPTLMAELCTWINTQLESQELPVPITAGIAHYQYATIHPYYDGNGRTARLLTTLILHAAGYGMKGMYSLEEYYARNLGGYYKALTIGPSHNYYMGRAEAEITPFVAYFCRGMADAFTAVRAQASAASIRGARDDAGILRKLDPKQRRVLELFRDRGAATSSEIAAHLGLSPRKVSALCRQWVKDGFLALHDPSRKSRSYRLGEAYESLVTKS